MRRLSGETKVRPHLRQVVFSLRSSARGFFSDMAHSDTHLRDTQDAGTLFFLDHTVRRASPNQSPASIPLETGTIRREETSEIPSNSGTGEAYHQMIHM
jgi:hypothetical protein